MAGSETPAIGKVSVSQWADEALETIDTLAHRDGNAATQALLHVDVLIVIAQALVIMTKQADNIAHNLAVIVSLYGIDKRRQ